MIEQHAHTIPRPGTLQPAAPLAVRNAARVMYAGAAACVIRAVVDIVTAGAAKTAIARKYPKLTAGDITTVTHIAVISGAAAALIGALLFVWIARVSVVGRNWARVTATVFCALGILDVLVASLDVGAGRTIANLIMSSVVAGIGLVSICALWQHSANAYFRHSRPPAV